MAKANKKAFTLRADVAEEFSGGSMAIGDGETLNIGELLEKGKGTIRTDDPAVIAALSDHPALKEGEADADSPAAQAASPSTETTSSPSSGGPS
jgi:hypothetical protein